MKTFLLSGEGIKSLALDQYPESAWEILSGDKPETELSEVYKRVAWLNRGIVLRSSVLSSVPFAIMDAKGDDIDNSETWENKINCLPNPRRILWLLEESMSLMNRAYLLKESNASKIVRNLKYVLPTTMTEDIDKNKGLVGFKRRVNNVEVVIPLEKTMYFYQPNALTEVGHGDNYSPAQAALQAAQVLYSLDAYANLYFKRGAIRATILSVAGNPPKEERERIESWWNDTLMGIRNAFKAKVFNADAVKAEQIGDGIEGLKKSELITSAREDISTALGIPQSLLFSNAANYATAVSDMRSFIKNTIIPECRLIQDVFNEQLLKSMGLRLDFRPESMEEFQEDEASRAGAYSSYVNSGMKPSIAAQLVGLDLPQGIEYDMLDDEDKPEDTTPLSDELIKWQRKAINSVGRGKTAAVEFESAIIKPEDYERIKAELKDCKSPTEIKSVFNRNRPKRMDVAQLIKSLQDATEALAEADEQ